VRFGEGDKSLSDVLFGVLFGSGEEIVAYFVSGGWSDETEPGDIFDVTVD
jgi:hypothetical protein